jgi:hypothetical protein
MAMRTAMPAGTFAAIIAAGTEREIAGSSTERPQQAMVVRRQLLWHIAPSPLGGKARRQLCDSALLPATLILPLSASAAIFGSLRQDNLAGVTRNLGRVVHGNPARAIVSSHTPPQSEGRRRPRTPLLERSSGSTPLSNRGQVLDGQNLCTNAAQQKTTENAAALCKPPP